MNLLHKKIWLAIFLVLFSITIYSYDVGDPIISGTVTPSEPPEQDDPEQSAEDIINNAIDSDKCAFALKVAEADIGITQKILDDNIPNILVNFGQETPPKNFSLFDPKITASASGYKGVSGAFYIFQLPIGDYQFSHMI
ncbi:MAG: hypothetical protein NUV67_04815, partial [archaeon]|nr:hypothetical protein [archaeon]